VVTELAGGGRGRRGLRAGRCLGAPGGCGARTPIFPDLMTAEKVAELILAGA